MLILPVVTLHRSAELNIQPSIAPNTATQQTALAVRVLLQLKLTGTTENMLGPIGLARPPYSSKQTRKHTAASQNLWQQPGGSIYAALVAAKAAVGPADTDCAAPQQLCTQRTPLLPPSSLRPKSGHAATNAMQNLRTTRLVATRHVSI
jgi:hypothetical protein